jgi:hypothetical protein
VLITLTAIRLSVAGEVQAKLMPPRLVNKIVAVSAITSNAPPR